MSRGRFDPAAFLSAFFGSWALQMTLGITVRNPLTVVLFVFLYICGVKLRGLSKFAGLIREVVPAAVGVVCAFLLREPVVQRLAFENGFFRLLSVFIVFIGYWLITRLAVRLFLEKGPGRKLLGEKALNPDCDFRSEEERTYEPYDSAFGRMIFIITFFACVIFYLPYFLYEFPGIMTADSLVQFDQLTYYTRYSNHHPVVHTLLIKFFYDIGLKLTRFHDKEVAISFYTAFQMIFMSFCCGVVVTETIKLTGKKNYRLATALIAFFALMPFNAVFAVTIWKDVPFAGISMLLCVTVAEIIRKRQESSVFDFAAFSVLGILFCLFRSNALYAFLVFALFFLLYLEKTKLFTKGLVAVIACILAVIVVKGPVFHAKNIAGPDFTESLSLPLQQVARVLVNDRQIEDPDLELIDAVIDRTYIHELYAPDFADNIKELVRAGNPYRIEQNKGKYLGLWLRLGLKYPGDYIAAWYDLEGGYVYTDVAYKVADADGIMANSHNLTWSPIIGGKFIKVKEILLKLSDFMPLYGMLFTAAIYTWALVASFAYAIRKKKNVLIQILMLFLVLTLLIAAPVVDFRYAYAVVMTWPIWLLGTNKL